MRFATVNLLIPRRASNAPRTRHRCGQFRPHTRRGGRVCKCEGEIISNMNSFLMSQVPEAQEIGPDFLYQQREGNRRTDSIGIFESAVAPETVRKRFDLASFTR